MRALSLQINGSYPPMQGFCWRIFAEKTDFLVAAFVP
jgi:hypothetical protein